MTAELRDTQWRFRKFIAERRLGAEFEELQCCGYLAGHGSLMRWSIPKVAGRIDPGAMRNQNGDIFQFTVSGRDVQGSIVYRALLIRACQFAPEKLGMVSVL